MVSRTRTREDFSGEIRFASKGDGPLHWQFGGFFTELEYDDKLFTGYDVSDAQADAILAAMNIPFPAGPGMFLPLQIGPIPGTWSCNPLGPGWDPSSGICPPNTDLFGTPMPQLLSPWFGADNLLQDKYFINQEYSLFASVDYDVSDKIGIAVEGRYTWEDRTMDDRYDVVAMYDTSVGMLEKNFKYFTPRVIVDYQMDDDTFFYASVAKGVKAGGVQPSQNVSGTFYDPESNWTYEAGTKMSLMDGRMNLTAAAYFIDWTDMQVRENVGLDNIVTNIGKAEIKGIEIETETLIGEGLRLKLAYTYQHGEIKEGSMSSVAGFCDYTHLETAVTPTPFPMPDFMIPAACTPADSFTIPFGPSAGTYVTALNVTTGDVSGNKLKNAPANTFVAGLNYSRTLENDMDLIIGVNYNYRSSIFWDEANSSSSGPTNLVSANIGIAKDNWSLTAWGKNLLDEDTPVASIRNFNILGQFLNTVQHREKARYGLTLKVSY